MSERCSAGITNALQNTQTEMNGTDNLHVIKSHTQSHNHTLSHTITHSVEQYTFYWWQGGGYCQIKTHIKQYLLLYRFGNYVEIWKYLVIFPSVHYLPTMITNPPPPPPPPQRV